MGHFLNFFQLLVVFIIILTEFLFHLLGIFYWTFVFSEELFEKVLRFRIFFYLVIGKLRFAGSAYNSIFYAAYPIDQSNFFSANTGPYPSLGNTVNIYRITLTSIGYALFE